MADAPAGVADWFRRRTYPRSSRSAGQLAALKRGRRVSVVLPARDEEATVGAIVDCLRVELVDGARLVDEVVVIDSHSQDSTATVARQAGAKVWHVDEILPELGPGDGKGEALWKSLAVTSGDIGVFLDADVDNFRSSFVTGLLDPLLREPELHFVKGFYERPEQASDGRLDRTGGGRVTELVARPLIAAEVPDLVGFVQPLAGECAFRRGVLTRVPFVSGYGVEIGLLIDVLRRVGLDGMGQADLGVRTHAPQDLEALTTMAMQVRLAVTLRTGEVGLHDRGSSSRGAVIPRFAVNAGERPRLESEAVAVHQRPPMQEILGARA